MSSQTWSCQRRLAMYMLLANWVRPEVRIAGLGLSGARFFLAKKPSRTSSMPRRFTGSASGVTMVAKWSSASVTPGTREAPRDSR